jgi:hypothetical protein
MRAMRIEMKRRNNTSSAGMLLLTAVDSARPRSKSTKPPARIHHRRFISQSMPRFSHGSRLPKKATISSIFQKRDPRRVAKGSLPGRE